MAKQKHVLDEVLSEAEKAQLESFCANPMMKDAVKKVLLFPIYHNGVMQKGKKEEPLNNFLLGFALNNIDKDDAVVGQELKIKAQAIRIIELAFMEIEGYEKVEQPKAKENPAR